MQCLFVLNGCKLEEQDRRDFDLILKAYPHYPACHVYRAVCWTNKTRANLV